MASKPSKIFPNFYLGSYEHAKDEDLIMDMEITHILSVGSGFEEEHEDVEYLIIDVLDMEQQDIKKHFEKCFKFIEKGRRDGIVLVHCNAGVSRAPTVCIAYLMKKLNLSLEDAMELVKDARPDIEPNPGFMRQLKEYYLQLHPELKAKKISAAPVEQAPAAQPATDLASPVAQASDESAPTEQSLEKTETKVVRDDVTYYVCRVCRYRVFDETDLVPHVSGQHEFSFRKRDHFGAEKVCSSYFIEERDWMGDLSALEGKISCPKCEGRLGSYNWGGTQCSCGTWCAPAFQILKARVDEKKPMAALVFSTPGERTEAATPAAPPADSAV